jgi:hypothetical protein
MTDSKSLDELEALLAKATAGEWLVANHTIRDDILIRSDGKVRIALMDCITGDDPWGQDKANAAAIVAAVNWFRTEGIAAARERDRLREAATALIKRLDEDVIVSVDRYSPTVFELRKALAGQP